MSVQINFYAAEFIRTNLQLQSIAYSESIVHHGHSHFANTRRLLLLLLDKSNATAVVAQLKHEETVCALFFNNITSSTKRQQCSARLKPLAKNSALAKSNFVVGEMAFGEAKKTPDKRQYRVNGQHLVIECN